MTSGNETWDDYLVWNNALIDVIYPDLDETVPVYLDVDGENLAKVAEIVGYSGDPKVGLCDAVRRVTVSSGEFSLARFSAANRSWMANTRKSRKAEMKPETNAQIPVPNSIGFLAVATLAALNMGTDEWNAVAYYPRLADLLGFSRGSAQYRSIEIQFRRYSERLWSELNSWLELHEGSKGLPSAYSLSKRYVGIPLSQALVRKADRQKFPIFFSQFNLSPGSELGADTLSRFLDAWFNSETCIASDSLKRLWANASTHERISEIVSLELSGWDGALPKGHRANGTGSAAVRLMATLQRGFRGERFDLALTYRHTNEKVMAGRLEIEASGGTWMPIDFQPLAGNLWRTSNAHGLDIASVLEGAVNLRDDENALVVGQRRPRSVVPLVRDEVHGGYSEEVALQLNADSIVLVRDSRDTLVQVRKVFAQYARPGFEEKVFAELPKEWVAFVGVQLFGVPPDSATRFKELQPIDQNQLTIAGGVRIPSAVRKWSVLAPPEIRVSFAGDKNVKLVLKDLMSDEELLEVSSELGVLVAELCDLGLSPGDYLASAYVDGSKDPRRQATIRLRSADEVDSRWNLAESLAYLLDEGENAKGVLSAVLEGSFDPVSLVDGAHSEGTFGIQIEPSLPLESGWVRRQEQAVVVRSKVILAPVSADSCVYTGAHRMRIETINDRRASKFQRGECSTCQMVKYYPMWPRPVRPSMSRSVAAPTAATVNVQELSRVAADESQNWNAAIDALMHLGGGSGSVMTSLAVQIDNDPLFVFNFANVLEQLGYVELQRDSDGSVKSWEISPTCLVGTRNGEWQLVGHWPPNLIEHLRQEIIGLGGVLNRHKEDHQPTRIVIQGVAQDVLEELEIGKVVDLAGSKMLTALPRISKLAQALPRQNMLGFTRAECFNVDTANWEETDYVDRPGAFRLKRDFRSLYVFRSQLDVENQTAVFSTPYLVKYLAAQLESIPLIHYDEESKVLLVPFGVELPGLYARAIALLSGRRPLDSRIRVGKNTRNCRSYFNVEKQDAQLLQTLLMG